MGDGVGDSSMFVWKLGEPEDLSGLFESLTMAFERGVMLGKPNGNLVQVTSEILENFELRRQISFESGFVRGRIEVLVGDQSYDICLGTQVQWQSIGLSTWFSFVHPEKGPVAFVSYLV